MTDPGEGRIEPAPPIDYMNPDVPPALPWQEVPLVRGTPQALAGYGVLVDEPDDFPVEVVTWPPLGWRPVDPGTGNQGGTVAGTFEVWWEGETLHGRNGAVGDEYVLGWSRNPGEIGKRETDETGRDSDRSRVLLWHANYHPDGGQLFMPADGQPFVVPLALPGDDISPEHFIAFYIDGGKGLYIHPNVWHEAIFPVSDRGRFHDRQGRVHARISCHFPREFGVFLSVPLREPTVP